MKYSIEEITSLIGAHRYGEASAEIQWLLIDSRSLTFPESTLFFAIRTQRNDGHRYIDELYNYGVRNFVVIDLPDAYQSRYADANFLVTRSPLIALQRLAERHREEFAIPVVGVTGSNGKTIVKEWIYQLLQSRYVVTRSPRSYNSQIGVPLSVWLIDEHSQVGVFEAGISMPGEMDALEDVIQPTIGVLTNIGEAHQENFRNKEHKCLEKLKLFKNVKRLIYCMDDEVATHGISTLLSKRNALFGWSLKDKYAPLFIKETKISGNSTEVTYLYNGKEDSFTIPFADKVSLENAINAFAVCLTISEDNKSLAADLEAYKSRLAQLEPVAMRLEVKEGVGGNVLISDVYNSDLKSLDIALDFMNRRLPKENKAGNSIKPKQFTLVMSDMLQTGIAPQILYQQIADVVKEHKIDTFIGVGEEMCRYIGLFNMTSYCFPTTDALIQSGLLDTLRQQYILIKGASRYGFERISSRLSLRVHETTLEVDLNALVENLNHYRSFLRPETKMVCMVKASAYGAGAIEVAKTLQDRKVDYLAVAVADEGADLRNGGITGNIIVMNPEMSVFHDLFQNHLEPEVYNFRLLNALISAAEHEGVTNFPIHIKLDTGMHRLGFDPEKDIDALIDRLKSQNTVIPKSVFSHFVGSDGDDFNDFTEMQFAKFDKASKKLQAAFGHKILRHICNTAGIERYSKYQLDMVRLGLGLYGIDPYSNDILHNVSTLRTTILQIRNVPANETVGYSQRGKLTRDSRIAAIPIGYADGLNRHLGCGHGYCLVNGMKAKYVGNICMDVCMIDVTDIPCKEGDDVIIFGNELPVTILSNLLDTIPYEILTAVSTRVKRVYFQD